MFFTYQDVAQLKNLAIASMGALPSRVKIPGKQEDLSTEEARWLAILNAATTVLNAKGFLRPEVVENNPLHILGQNSGSIHE